MSNHLLKSISYSAYRDYKKCPKLFYYRKVLKLKLPEDPLQLVFGKSLHLALELQVKERKDPVKVFQQDFTRDKLLSLDLVKFLEYEAEGIRLLTFWKEKRKEIMKPLGKVSEAEIEFSIKVGQDPLTKLMLDIPPINGVVDFVLDGTNGIGDYKTSSKKYTQEIADTSDQPTFYYLWHLIERGELPKAFYYIVFRKNIKKEPIQVVSTTRTLTQVSNLLADIQSVIHSIDNREFSLRHTEGFCDCYKYEEMLKV